MTQYLPRLRVSIEHRFYEGGLARQLRFKPDASTAAWLREHDAVWRETGDGLEMSAPPTTQAEPTQTLHWIANSGDALWRSVTDHLGSDPRYVPCLQPAQAASPNGPDQPLHSQDTLMPGDLWPLAVPGALAGVLDATASLRLPAFVLRLPAPDLRAEVTGPARYRATFAARAPIWKYFLMGDWQTDELHVVDATPRAEGQSLPVSFTDPERETLASGQAAQTIRSRSGIALHERPEQRFQLRSRHETAVRVLVKRLPMASADYLGRATIDGKSMLVSEIFVHR
ncbi:MAG: hypothetical protein AB3X44_10305 [Leptothrix sp. (in: b-proteobacteria)]